MRRQQCGVVHDKFMQNVPVTIADRTYSVTIKVKECADAQAIKIGAGQNTTGKANCPLCKTVRKDFADVVCYTIDEEARLPTRDAEIEEIAAHWKACKAGVDTSNDNLYADATLKEKESVQVTMDSVCGDPLLVNLLINPITQLNLIKHENIVKGVFFVKIKDPEEQDVLEDYRDLEVRAGYSACVSQSMA